MAQLPNMTDLTRYELPDGHYTVAATTVWQTNHKRNTINAVTTHEIVDQPDDGEYGPFLMAVIRDSRRRLSEAIDHQIHQRFWGTPCGPTLSMVHPPKLLGLLGGQQRR